MEVAKERDVPVMIVGLDVGNNYGPEYKAAFDGIYTDLAAEYDAPLYPHYFEALESASPDGSILPFTIGDGLHPSAEGIELIVADMGPPVAAFVRSLAE